MCSPKNGENTPEDVEREVEELEEKNGMSDRRKPHFYEMNGGAKLLIVFIAGALVSFGLPRLWELNREGGELGEIVEADRRMTTDQEERIRMLEAIAAEAIPKQWDTMEHLEYASEQAMENAQQDARLNGHIMECASRTQRLVELSRDQGKILLELRERMIRMEAEP